MLIHEILPVGPLQCNCQIFGDDDAGKALVVDPGDDIPTILRLLEGRGWSVEKILFTHAHIDHIGQAAELKRASGAPTYLHRGELPVLASLSQQAAWLGAPAPEAVEIDNFYDEGDVVEFGGAELQVLNTPGHSPGSVSFYIPSEGKLVAGDTLFYDSIGRSDLPGGDSQQLLDSIRDKILTLDDATEVFPGHGPQTTVGRERRMNMFLAGLEVKT